jgi:predicted Zn-dependent protease
MKFACAAILSGILAGALAAADRPKDDPGQIGTREVGKCVNFYSVEREIALGKQLAEEVAREAKIDPDPLLGEFINRVGQNLVHNSDAKMAFRFQVIDDEAPNAFALPGGFVFVNTGLIKLASEEDEFAGALAHEIAHVAARHMTCRVTKSQIANLASIPAGILLGGGWAGMAGRQGMSLGMPAMFMKFSREDESEADYLGTQYMYAAGYDPAGAVSIFEKLESLQRKQPGAAARIFSSHPLDADRINRTEKEIQRILPPRAEYVVTTSEYAAMRERLIARSLAPVPDASRPRLKAAPGDSRNSQEDPEARPTIRRRDWTD